MEMYTRYWLYLLLVIPCELLLPDYNDPMFADVIDDHVQLNLTSIPSDADTNATFFNFHGNALTAISANYFSNFTNLLLLDVSDNLISVLDSQAFAGTPIIYLELSMNGIQGDFPNLCVLNATLQVAILNHNDLTQVSNASLSCMSELKRLDLLHNTITEFPYLQALPTHYLFIHLAIGDNPLNITNPMPLYNLTSLKHLSLKSTHIVELPDFSELPASNDLELLYLDGNDIGTISPQALAALSNSPIGTFSIRETGVILPRLAPALAAVRELDIFASSLPSLYVPYLPSVEYVYIRRSDLTSFPDVTALNRSLEFLQINHCNHLDSVKMVDVLAPLEELDVLNIANNKFTTITDLSVLLPTLDKLQLAGNPWHCDCGLQWMGTTSIQLLKFEQAMCASPPHLSGTPLDQLDFSSFNCSERTLLRCFHDDI